MVYKFNIEWDDQTGQLKMDGPANGVVAYGILELVKDAVRMQIHKQKVAQPTPADIALLMKGS